jgi:copper homeostasis protein
VALRVEICVESLRCAFAAEHGGADRVELCANLAVGGITPSAGVIAVACRRLSIPVHVLIRPRAGDFAYDEAELEAMHRDLATARNLGAAGIVVGVLDADGRIDADRLADLVAAARPLSVTFHRAFDGLADAIEAIEALAGLGIDRVLTAGGPGPARDHLDRLADLQRVAGERLVILAGGSLALDDLHALDAAGIREVHLGSAACRGGGTDAVRVREIVAEGRRVG